MAELTEKKIEAGWHETFTTSNPFCPCNLKSFTKAVRWAERELATRAGATACAQLVNYFAEWEQIMPPDAREALRSIVEPGGRLS